MKPDRPRLPRMASSADDPVSPEVAPRTLSVACCFASTNSNRLARSCSAMSLNASVGPLDTRSRNRLGSRASNGGVGAVDHRLQVRGRYVVGVARKNRECELPIVDWTLRRELGECVTRIA